MTITSTIIHFSCKMLFTYHSCKKFRQIHLMRYKRNSIQCRYAPTPNLKVARPEKHENSRIRKGKNRMREYQHDVVEHFSPFPLYHSRSWTCLDFSLVLLLVFHLAFSLTFFLFLSFTQTHELYLYPRFASLVRVV